MLQVYLFITTSYHGQDTLIADFTKGIWENMFPHKKKHVKCLPELIATFGNISVIDFIITPTVEDIVYGNTRCGEHMLGDKNFQ